MSVRPTVSPHERTWLQLEGFSGFFVMSVRPTVSPHERTWLQMEGFSRNLVFEHFS